MITPVDELHLQTAIELANRGLFSTSPNPRVGCVLVKGERVIGRGWHRIAGGPHAEAAALADASESAAGATAYVSLEPCSFTGRTPACADALIGANVRRVVIALTDPHPRVAGSGIQRLRAAGVEVDVIEHPDAAARNAGYLLRQQRGWPLVRLKVAMSLDGRTGMASGESQWITGPEARADVQYWRARSCAVLTGIGTVLADDPRMNVRDERYGLGGRVRQPLRVVVDRSLRTPPSAQILAGDGPVLLAHADDVKAPAGAPAQHSYLACGPGRIDLERLLRALAERGCNEVHVEAGAGLLGAFLEAGLWDELLVYVAPKLLGSGGRPLAVLPLDRLDQAIAATIVTTQTFGADLRLRLVPDTGPAALRLPAYEHSPISSQYTQA
jgi:diaminohydroxyphosphoribosylaminopyrimidine deaminase/5-amino-6-(5-phosphoribosylamino)uracil reductase